MACGTPDPGSSTTSSSTYSPDAPTGPFAGTSTAVRLNASAVVETDADHDGYGDVTQDPCPQTAGSQAPCPAPDTRISKKPKKRSAHRRVKVAFTSTIPGSTFTCAIDKSSGPQPCTSPLKRKLSYGKHTIVVTALSHGVPDPTPVIVRFRILRPAT